LFQRAIHQSAGYQMVTRDRREDFLDEGLALQVSLLGESGRDIDQLRQVPAGQLLEGASRVYADYQPDVVVDGYTLPQTALDAFEGGRARQVDLLIGTNADEWRMYLDPGTDDQAVQAWIHENASANQRALQASVSDTPLPLRQLDRLYTGQQFVCPSLLMAALASQAGKGAFVYYFQRQRTGEGGDALGAYHGAEIPYLFDKHDAWLPTDELDRSIGRAMQSYWVNFARTGNPNSAGGVNWPRFEARSAQVLRIGDTIEPITHPEVGLCASLAPAAD
jgi:para-nitrobenzyl esterase